MTNRELPTLVDTLPEAAIFTNTDKVMRAVAAGPMGLVAVGYLEWYLEATDTTDTDAAVWVSQDGLSWTLVSEDGKALWRFPFNFAVSTAITPVVSGDIVYGFGLENSRDMEAWSPRLKFVEDWTYFDEAHPKMGWMNWFARWPLFRWAQWTVRYRFAA